MIPDVSPAILREREEYAEWREILDQIIAVGSRVLLLGAPDVGKTTLARLLVNRSVSVGKQTFLIDSDLGQSEVGPPACVALAKLNEPVRSLAELHPQSLLFIGNTSPSYQPLEQLTAVRRLADEAGTGFLVIDTGGYVLGATARRLNQQLIDILAPDHIVAMQRKNELEQTIAPFRLRSNLTLLLPSIPNVIGRKPPAYRTQRRTMRFAAYFDDAVRHDFSFDQIAIIGSWLGSGSPVAPHLLKFINQTLGLNHRAYYAEMSGNHLGLMLNLHISADSPEISIIQHQFKAREIGLTLAPRLKNLLVGLETSSGKLLGMGLIVGIDFKRRILSILSPLRSPEAACIIRLGLMRVNPNGTEIGCLKPGDLT